LQIELHEGRGELLTVTGAQTVDGHSTLRGDAHALDAAARACDAVGRLFETSEPHPGVFHLLCRKLSLLDQKPTEATRASALVFRLKLLVAAGLAPQLGACACCGEREHLVGFSGAAGGVVCSSCWPSESPAETRTVGAFSLGEQAHQFMTEALGRSLSEAPAGEERVLGQVERAISETLEHHAHVHLMPATDRRSIPHSRYTAGSPIDQRRPEPLPQSVV
jgi:DNA repair protein RecO (recombination protein O)